MSRHQETCDCFALRPSTPSQAATGPSGCLSSGAQAGGLVTHTLCELQGAELAHLLGDSVAELRCTPVLVSLRTHVSPRRWLPAAWAEAPTRQAPGRGSLERIWEGG